MKPYVNLVDSLLDIKVTTDLSVVAFDYLLNGFNASKVNWFHKEEFSVEDCIPRNAAMLQERLQASVIANAEKDFKLGHPGTERYFIGTNFISSTL